MRSSKRISPVDAQPELSKRKLRSKEAPKIDESLFNYEEDHRLINPDEEIQLSRTTKKLVPFHQPKDSTCESFKDLNFCLNLVEVSSSTKRALRKNVITKRILNVNMRLKDPLDEVMYSNYHRKMEKEEKRMSNRDREKIHSEADLLRSQLETLIQNDWQKLLPTITYIRDPRDMEEMNQKRQWTINSLNLLLGKYLDWKKRDDKFFGRLRSSSSLMPHTNHQFDLTLYTNLNKYDYVGDSDTDEEEDLLTLEEIKARRSDHRSKRFGPVIKIKFGDNVVVAEPFKSTRIEKIE